MGKGGKQEQQKAVYTWDEIAKHDKREDRWMVIQGEVYNITNWARKHPGGTKVISHYSGQDATDAFTAFHNDVASVKKYLKPLHVGSVKDTQNRTIDEDFRKLRSTAEQMGLFKPSYTYFGLYLGHIMVLELLAAFTLIYFGVGWAPFLISLAFYGISQAQAAWLQHDFGHLSVFSSTRLNHVLHYFTMGFLKGASPDWWNHMHYQHHAKPNVLDKDPDVRVEQLFVVGDVMPVEVAKSGKSSFPYNQQHKYFPFFIPPLLFPLYFQFMLFRHVYTRKLWIDVIIMGSYFFRFCFFLVPLVGWGWTFFYYEAFRIIESTWFVWVAQSNHIPMNIDHDDQKPWLKLQMAATCDVEKSFFNDWFTGHLNFQIEHHLFPTMPRHNLYKIQPLVQSLCKKHGIPHEVKSLYQSFADIIKSLKHSGEIWSAAYHQYHLS
ncbi:fatty acid desaturase 2-like isoform X2 [Mytilus trossulus]|uniref:fatty acid desaturase 2-like isoform X2 n=1 Tax=Mytilus trossulus TaxID=6551 RepID=UPI0030043E09